MLDGCGGSDSRGNRERHDVTAMPAGAIVGLSTSCAGIAIQSSIQLATDSAMRGRVMVRLAWIFRGARGSR